ncbi:hypothetical protein MIND_01195100 [Mycena indigotica]|uniref:MYND-type domain-containing protein n=1 Tax=Mycena indigotica TaxID=2126181 RepID=A0A8H6VYN1_9AGAR|nr:uncharacterized protein MIND_01195100 [Mycena indigotica]KAF7292959.1 hypothetical protein MIND_01195100 [Mycena indigotica]
MSRPPPYHQNPNYPPGVRGGAPRGAHHHSPVPQQGHSNQVAVPYQGYPHQAAMPANHSYLPSAQAHGAPSAQHGHHNQPTRPHQGRPNRPTVPATGGPPPISIHTDFAPSPAKIMEYIVYYTNHHQFLPAHPHIKGQLSAFIQRCQRPFRSKLKQPRFKRTNPSPQPGENILHSVQVIGRTGRFFDIYDFYSALGYIISNAELNGIISENNREKTRTFHRKILAYFTKWVATSAQTIFIGTLPPRMTGIAYRNFVEGATTFQLGAVYSCQPERTGTAEERAAATKLGLEEGRNLYPGVRYPDVSRREYTGANVKNGQCLEVHMLSDLLAMDGKDGKIEIHGMAVQTRVVFPMNSYDDSETNRKEFRKALESPCWNCLSLFRSINQAMLADPQRDDTRTNQAFQFYDQSGRELADMGRPNWHEQQCSRSSCRNRNSALWHCLCQKVFYCSDTCSKMDRATHNLECPVLAQCSFPSCTKLAYQGEGIRNVICQSCVEMRTRRGVAGRVYACYCSAEHLQADEAMHRAWCSNPLNLGPTPHALATALAKYPDLYQLLYG